MSARDRLIEELRRSGTGHTGMGATALVDAHAHQLADVLREAGHADAADLIDPEVNSFAEYTRQARHTGPEEQRGGPEPGPEGTRWLKGRWKW